MLLPVRAATGDASAPTGTDENPEKASGERRGVAAYLGAPEGCSSTPAAPSAAVASSASSCFSPPSRDNDFAVLLSGAASRGFRCKSALSRACFSFERSSFTISSPSMSANISEILKNSTNPTALNKPASPRRFVSNTVTGVPPCTDRKASDNNEKIEKRPAKAPAKNASCLSKGSQGSSVSFRYKFFRGIRTKSGKSAGDMGSPFLLLSAIQVIRSGGKRSLKSFTESIVSTNERSSSADLKNFDAADRICFF
mmetsp:Transcript_33080/g.65614  ORF Transcript_33080/g.65614 Transcript_33080/m.65614 type:complete len:254 (+) Transcript_33080:172-933(+)